MRQPLVRSVVNVRHRSNTSLIAGLAQATGFAVWCYAGWCVADFVRGARRALYSESKLNTAHSTVKRFAFEAFPNWEVTHPDRDCPARLDELNEYVNSTDIRDPWGNDYRFTCGPRGKTAKLVVLSAGEDGEWGTHDDIRSDWK